MVRLLLISLLIANIGGVRVVGQDSIEIYPSTLTLENVGCFVTKSRGMRDTLLIYKERKYSPNKKYCFEYSYPDSFNLTDAYKVEQQSPLFMGSFYYNKKIINTIENVSLLDGLIWLDEFAIIMQAKSISFINLSTGKLRTVNPKNSWNYIKHTNKYAYFKTAKGWITVSFADEVKIVKHKKKLPSDENRCNCLLFSDSSLLEYGMKYKYLNDGYLIPPKGDVVIRCKELTVDTLFNINDYLDKEIELKTANNHFVLGDIIEDFTIVDNIMLLLVRKDYFRYQTLLNDNKIDVIDFGGYFIQLYSYNIDNGIFIKPPKIKIH